MLLFPFSAQAQARRLFPILDQFYSFIRTHDLMDMPLGRITLDDDRLYINNCLCDAVEASQQRLEAHRRYGDLHLLLQGEETIGWKPRNELPLADAPYDEKEDICFWTDTPSTYITLHPYHSLLVLPSDAHAPLIGKGKIRKAVVKFLLDEEWRPRI